MGGNALRGRAFTRRFNKEEYKEVTDDVFYKLCHSEFKGNIDLVPSFKDKADFGDADFCLEILAPLDVRAEIQRLFNPTVISVNDKVYSFDYKELQVDLICLDPEIYYSALNFYSWNDCGMIMGRLIKSIFSLALGYKGLILPVRIDNTRILDKLVVSRDYKEILELVGMDYNRWKAGFNNAKEVFEFAINYPYFDPEIYKLENLNHLNRKRNAVRKVWMEFLKYLEDKQIKNSGRDRTEIINKVNNYLIDKGLIA